MFKGLTVISDDVYLLHIGIDVDRTLQCWSYNIYILYTTKRTRTIAYRKNFHFREDFYLIVYGIRKP